ncbi:MAG: HlyD family efflux transporter periplasmic adaptor subunit [Candidatus Delongbacteria bacterium]|nr:HlyD family efflux transporter periplasmic adaptor subunit [Candidatus Delongbacteria bacterium]MBN2835527.1 HlyD family efflux transporter periplasmic adaptor subunit [Candidatus Delongbacteria bacterium]
MKYSRMMKLVIAVAILSILTSCDNNKNLSDAYGNFEADEIIVSAENGGKIIFSNIEEGIIVEKDMIVACVDTTQLDLKIRQLEVQKRIISDKTKTISTQLAVIEEQIKTAKREHDRVEKLYSDKAATGKQLDDVNSQVSVLEKQYQNVKTQEITIDDEITSIDIQILQLKDQIHKSIVKSPIHGTVLTKFANFGEVTAPGKPLFKIADTSKMDLKVYIPGNLVSTVKLGQKVVVKVDNADNTLRSYEGIITYISDKAEFTPKIIQTRQERVSQVSAVKIEVINDGSLKIGMPAEADFVK